MWYVRAMDYYSAVRGDDMPPFATAGMDLEIILLREVSEMEKVESRTISVRCGI